MRSQGSQSVSSSSICIHHAKSTKIYELNTHLYKGKEEQTHAADFTYGLLCLSFSVWTWICSFVDSSAETGGKIQEDHRRKFCVTPSVTFLVTVTKHLTK